MGTPGTPYSREYGDPTVNTGTPSCERQALALALALALFCYCRMPSGFPYSRKYGHPGAYIYMNMGIRGAHFWGCLYSLDTGTGVTEDMASRGIWHPRVKFSRDNCTPLGKMASPKAMGHTDSRVKNPRETGIPFFLS